MENQPELIEGLPPGVSLIRFTEFADAMSIAGFTEREIENAEAEMATKRFVKETPAGLFQVFFCWMQQDIRYWPRLGNRTTSYSSIQMTPTPETMLAKIAVMEKCLVNDAVAA